MENYRIIRQLGKGNFGVVSLAECEEDGCLYVVKQVSLRGLTPVQRDGAQREVILRRMRALSLTLSLSLSLSLPLSLSPSPRSGGPAVSAASPVHRGVP